MKIRIGITKGSTQSKTRDRFRSANGVTDPFVYVRHTRVHTGMVCPGTANSPAYNAHLVWDAVELANCGSTRVALARVHATVQKPSTKHVGADIGVVPTTASRRNVRHLRYLERLDGGRILLRYATKSVNFEQVAVSNRKPGTRQLKRRKEAGADRAS